jgi:hypothetical protein
MREKHAPSERGAEPNRKGKIPVPAKHNDELRHLPPYHPTARPPLPPKHPHRTPTPNRRGR